MFGGGVQFNLRPSSAGKSTDLKANGRVREGGKVFGQGIKGARGYHDLGQEPNALHDGCRIHYRDIGDYLSREQKLTALRRLVSISGFSDWQADFAR